MFHTFFVYVLYKSLIFLHRRQFRDAYCRKIRQSHLFVVQNPRVDKAREKLYTQFIVIDYVGGFIMRLEHLRYLLEIDRCHSINKAAQNLFIAHSTLSYILQNIENDLGYLIFERSKQGVMPTAQGQKILKDIQTISNLVDTWTLTAEQQPAISGHVHITNLPIFSRIFRLGLFVRLQEQYPDLHLHFHEAQLTSLEELFSLLKKSTSRIFLGPLTEEEQHTFETRFADDAVWNYCCINVDTMALFVSGNNPFAQRKYLQPEELHALPMLFYPNVDKKFGYHAILKYFSATQTYTMSTSDLILNMVADDACTALASRLLLSDSPLFKNGQIIQLPIAGYPMSMIYYLLFPAEAQISTAEKIVVSAIQEAFAQLEEKFLNC